MNELEILLSHPHDHFSFRHIAMVPNTCFVLIPFEERFTIVYETIVTALQGLMVCSRADDLPLGRPILDRILTGIRSAELVIADLTGKNPNVFYELGLAHTRTKNVLLLTQDMSEVPFDLRGLFCHTYSPYSTSGLRHLESVIRTAAAEVRAKSVPAMLQGMLARTRQIVEYMERELSSPKSLNDLMIRIQAGFSSIANVGNSDSEVEETREYGEWLERERECLIQMIEKGARLQAIIYPPEGPWTLESRRRQRFDMLLEFLNNRDDLWNRCEFVVSTQEGSNLLFFGDDILFEGHKTGVESGYGWTFVYTDKDHLLTRLTMFDMLFESARGYTLRRYGSEGSDGGDPESLRRAVIDAVVMASDGTRSTR